MKRSSCGILRHPQRHAAKSVSLQYLAANHRLRLRLHRLRLCHPYCHRFRCVPHRPRAASTARDSHHAVSATPLPLTPPPASPSSTAPPSPSTPSPPTPPPPMTEPPPLQPLPSPGYTLVMIWCPSCKKNLIDNRDFKCYPCQDRRYYYTTAYEDE
jgi:hypothetical protein